MNAPSGREGEVPVEARAMEQKKDDDKDDLDAWDWSPDLTREVVLLGALEDLLRRFWNSEERPNKATVFRNLMKNIGEWVAKHDARVIRNRAEVRVPAQVFRKALGRDLAAVKRGLCGVVSVQRHSGYVLHFNLVKLLFLGSDRVVQRREMRDKFEMEKWLFRAEQFDFKAPWTPLLDARFCPQQCGVQIVAEFTGRALIQLDLLRLGYLRLPGCKDGRATRAAHYAVAFPTSTDAASAKARQEEMEKAARGWAKARSFFSFVWNQMVRCLLYERDGSTPRTFVDDLRHNCAEPFCSMIGNTAGIQAQLAKLITKDNLIKLLELEIVQRRVELLQRLRANDMDQCKAPRERIEHLSEFIEIVSKGGLTASLQEWTRVMAEANKSRKEKSQTDPRTGPPKFQKASKVFSIPLCNSRANDVFNFLSTFGIPTEVHGVHRDETESVEAVTAFSNVKKLDVKLLCNKAAPEVMGRCHLVKAVQRRKTRSAGRPQSFFFHRQLQVIYAYDAPVIPRTPLCLADGLGGITVIDPGGRAFTMIRLEGLGDRVGNTERILMVASEFFTNLLGMILKACARSEALLSRAAMSRSARTRDRKVQAFYRQLEAKVIELECNGAMNATQLRALRKQVNLGKRHGALGNEFKTNVEVMADEPAASGDIGDEEGDVLASMGDADMVLKTVMQQLAADLIQERVSGCDIDRLEELDALYDDQHLGPLWTNAVEDRYERFCDERRRKGLPIPTRPFS